MNGAEWLMWHAYGQPVMAVWVVAASLLRIGGAETASLNLHVALAGDSNTPSPRHRQGGMVCHEEPFAAIGRHLAAHPGALATPRPEQDGESRGWARRGMRTRR